MLFIKKKKVVHLKTVVLLVVHPLLVAVLFTGMPLMVVSLIPPLKVVLPIMVEVLLPGMQTMEMFLTVLL